MMIDEVERYQKILEDWSWSGKPQTAKGAPQSERRPAPAVVKPAASRTQYQQGAILCLNGRTIAIYKQPIPSKEYDLMLVLFPNNIVKTQGIAIEGHQIEEIGSLPPDMLERVQREMKWNRDMVVFHCYSYDDVQKIPEQMAPPSAMGGPEGSSPGVIQPQVSLAEEQTLPRVPVAEVASAPPTPATLKRGQRLQVKFGDKAWYAVYWGKDDQGQVVAHQTNKDWSLMHLDLHRFGTDLQIDPNIDSAVIAEIEASIAHK